MSRLLFAGDWHADFSHAQSVIDHAAEIGARRVAQVGDFGFWPRFSEGQTFMTKVAARAIERGVSVWFCDGNHEDHSRLPHASATGPISIAPSVWWVPRGHVVEWGGRRILFFGGAVSVDKPRREPGIDWFEDEVPDEHQWSRAESADAIDIVVAHEGLPGTPLVSTYEHHVPEEIDVRAASLRERMGRLADSLAPSLWVHGHWHQRMTARRGQTKVECLHESRAEFSDTVLACDLETLETWPEPVDP